MSSIPAKMLLEELTAKLTSGYDARESGNIATELLLHFCRLDKVKIALNERICLDLTLKKSLNHALRRLLNQEPLQHILGSIEFYGFTLKTDSRALIPRPETEELVDWIVQENRTRVLLKVLDIGTGTGCIAIALAKFLPKARVAALDLSEAALELAGENAKLNHVRLDYHQTNVLNEALPGQYDLIVSNPPYIPMANMAKMAANVLDFEPGLALFVEDEQPLIFYERIAKLAGHHLKPQGKLYFEIHEDFGSQVIEVLTNLGFPEVELKQDLQGKNRMIKGIRDRRIRN